MGPTLAYASGSEANPPAWDCMNSAEPIKRRADPDSASKSKAMVISKQSAITMAVFVALYLPPLWLVSNLFREAGGVVFLVGLGVAGVCLLALYSRWRKPLFVLLLVSFLSSATLVIVEAFVRLQPDRFTGMAGNYLYGRFHAYPGGIYERDEHMGKRIRPGQACDMYFNGYRWRHEANELGFRGPNPGRADVVFLGDSMIYGHGVETDETVPHRFGVHSGRTTANLGVQGTGLIQSWMMLRRIGVSLQPRIVFVCSHPNDTGDVTQYYARDQIERFVAGGAEDDAEPIARPRFHPRSAWNPNEVWDRHFAVPFCSAGIVRLLAQGAKIHCDWQRNVASTPAELSRAAVSQWQPPQTELDHLAWRASCMALARMQYLCQAHGATLVVFDLGFPPSYSASVEAEARRLGVDYVPAGRATLERALAGEDIYLKADGHWSPHGCDAVAQELVEWTRTRHPELTADR